MFVLSTGSLYNCGLERVFALARQVDFDGIVAESGPEHLGAGQDGEVERALRQAVSFSREHFQQTFV